MRVLLCYLFFLGNFTVVGPNEVGALGHFWSLAVEEQFYLLWPQLTWRLSRSKVLATALSLAFISILCRIAGHMLGWNAYVIYKITPSRLDGISLGCAVAAAVGMPTARAWLARWWKAIACVAAVALVVGFAALKCSYFLFDERAQMIAIPPVIALAAVLIFAASEQLLPSSLSALFCSRPLVYLGRRSYALYLIHVPICDYIATKFSPEFARQSPAARIFGWLALTVLAVSISIALAEISWRVLEQPAQALKKRLYEQKRRDEMSMPAADLLPESEFPRS